MPLSRHALSRLTLTALLALLCAPVHAEPAAPPSEPEVKKTAPRSVNARRVKDHKFTAEGALGVLPEGIGVAVGQPAPTASVTDDEGKALELASLWSEKTVLLIFYRGGWCPYCNSQVHALSQRFGDFESRGVTPVMISVDTPDESAKTRATYTVPFPLVSDPELAAHTAFNVLFQVPPELVEKYRGFGIDLEAASGQEHHIVAVPSIFLIAPGGRVLWAHADPEYKVRPAPEQLLNVIDGVLSK